MKINACLIVKDDSELKQLEKALDSITPYVEGIYITSTGKDIKGIEKLCKDNNINYSHFPWNDDFSAARNFNFSQAPQDSDYIFWMDADDVLVGGEYLQGLAETAKNNGKDIVFLTYWYGCKFNGEPSPQTLERIDLEQMRERLLRPGVTTWKARLHETPVPNNGVKENYTSLKYDPKDSPIAVLHTAEDDVTHEKMARNKRILEMQLKEEREKGEADPRTLLYLMKIYAELEDPKEWLQVLDMGKEYLDKSGWDEERGTANELMGQVWGQKGNWQKAADYFHKALAEWPTNILYYIRLASAYYNLKNYRSARHWLEMASNMDIDKRFTSSLTNIHGMKVMFADLLVKLAYNVDKDTAKALKAAEMLYKELPTKENEEQVKFLMDLNDLNEACKHTDMLARYLDSIGERQAIVDLLETLPDGIATQPFARKIRNQFVPPRKWKSNEICYFANFGQKGFEKWDSSSLEKGIGGSETAVIELANEWAKLGYVVTVYGDPLSKDASYFSERGGYRFLPWYDFNIKDSFNIFIQWRSWALAGKVKAKKYYIDLHDIYSAVDLKKEELQNIDKIMVKTKYHRDLAPTIPDDKFLIISNGI